MAWGRAKNNAWKKLEEIGAFNLTNSVAPEELQKLTEVERAFLDYYRAARDNNPVYKHPWPEMQDKYREYVAKGRPKAEQDAYDKLVKAIKSDIARAAISERK